MKELIRFIPAAAIAATAAAVFIVGGIFGSASMDNVKAPSYDDVPDNTELLASYSRLSGEMTAAASAASALEEQIKTKTATVSGLTAQSQKLAEENAAKEEKYKKYDEITKRYQKCAEDAEKLTADCERFNYSYTVTSIPYNYDKKSLQAITGNNTIQKGLGGLGGFFGNLVANSTTQMSQQNMDKLSATVDYLTANTNKYLREPVRILDEIKAISGDMKRISDGTLSGDELAFEIDRFEEMYPGSEALLNEKRKELVLSMQKAQAAMHAYYPVYEMLLSISDDNQNFLNTLTIAENNMYISAQQVRKDGDPVLSSEEERDIYLEAYGAFPLVYELITSVSYPSIIDSKTTVKDAYIAMRSKVYSARESRLVLIYEYGRKSTSPEALHFYSADGKFVYGVYKGKRVAMKDGALLYSDFDDAKAQEAVQSSEWLYKNVGNSTAMRNSYNYYSIVF